MSEITHIFPMIELKDGGDDDATGAVEKALADLTKTVDDRLAAIETKGVDAVKLAVRLDEIEKKLARPAIGGKANGDDDDAAKATERKAFAGFLRHGREALAADEVKSLAVSTDTSGGYLAPPDFLAELQKKLVQTSPIRAVARVSSTSAGAVILPVQTGTPTAGWVSELGDRPAAESTYGQLEIAIAEAACYIDISNRLLEDASVDIESEVSTDLATEFGRIESAAFVNGDGLGKPSGFMAAAGVGSVNSGAATAVTADGLVSLMYSVASEYRGRGSWIMNGKTLGSIRKLKTSDGQYLWQPGLQAGQPETILGRPAIEAVDMPDEAAGAYPVAFGDFGSAYRIFDRLALALIRDPYSVAVKGLTRFHARRRVGGSVVRPEAIAKLMCSA